MNQNLVEIKNLFVEYETTSIQGKQVVHAINDVSLNIKKGEILAIAGESGCGKSTLAKTLIKLVSAKSGEIKYKNLNVLNLTSKDIQDFRTQVQMIFQNPYSSLNPKMKIYDILKEPLLINKNVVSKFHSGKKIKELKSFEFDELIRRTAEQVGVSSEALQKYPHEFSGGQRQRIAIARALIMNPKLILADEPVSALDVSIQAQIINLLKDLKQDYNLTILFISHDLSVIRYIADRVAIMYLGEIIEIGSTQEIFTNPKHPYTQALLASIPRIGKSNNITLKGDLPTPTNLPEGCKFQTRCSRCMNNCKTQIPKLKQLDNTHEVSCFLY